MLESGDGEDDVVILDIVRATISVGDDGAVAEEGIDDASRYLTGRQGESHELVEEWVGEKVRQLVQLAVGDRLSRQCTQRAQMVVYAVTSNILKT